MIYYCLFLYFYLLLWSCKINAALLQTNLQARLNELLQENSKLANLVIV